ncbi:drug/metabolite transporter (DMT)-like permease [Rhodopseudomonas thermotolerans]|uniref:Drug/metabolite transporter (DMT)-like permease n=2 Tax=Rhodopseudomonas TaxID=1073 RepID=A0A336JS97_9BRAD|nr:MULTISPECIES: DMT family transporter [Rhodopseudomonas]RED29080.1 drug/metabolite transporter (DMT)-like permease [Rhodopseudomonas pentothenatexigens]REF92317.1 drug/metabolite transporter (DMT)-like permease [Rhodopseudomonas thermotolerans]SSW92492.1 drug/metabolite transporter (DMT)-like permease [Rhodopseudomonas pentothenatexigens]
MSSAVHPIHPRDWVLLIALSILWGASFFCVGVALKELPPFTIVFLRAAIAALVLLLIVGLRGIPMPRGVTGWLPFVGMACLNFVVPFSCLVTGQTFISTGLASVLNATTPLFTVVVMAAAGEERLTAQRVIGVAVGILGVAILRGVDLGEAQTGIGVGLCLLAAMSYGLSALLARRRLVGFAPLTTATSQMVAAAIITGVIAANVDQPWRLPAPSWPVILAVVALGTLSTALGYVLFFRIVARSGSTNVMLVTLLIPVTAILLGTVVLREAIGIRELIGAVVIASALLIIDGRALAWLQPRRWRSERS